MVVFAVCGCDVGVEKAYGQTILAYDLTLLHYGVHEIIAFDV
jgi:hypothetical protein